MISFNTVSKSFKDTRAIKGLSFRVEEGETYGILGPNGAGKTTALRMMAGILRPDSGSISFGETPLKPEHQSMIGYLPEERGLYPKMSVLDQLMYFARLKGLSKSKAGENALYWLNRFGLSDQQKRETRALSKGNQQKLQLITAIAHNPRLLILDEPFSGLDLINTDELLWIIEDLKKSGTTLVISSHLLDQVEPLCSALTFLNHGQVLLQGTLQEIKSNYSKESEWQLLTNSPELALEALQKSPLVATCHLEKNSLQLKLADGALLKNVLNEMPEEVAIEGLEKKSPALRSIVLQALQAQR
jgi:ABC-2 type transport system ATP-binding protein